MAHTYFIKNKRTLYVITDNPDSDIQAALALDHC